MRLYLSSFKIGEHFDSLSSCTDRCESAGLSALTTLLGWRLSIESGACAAFGPARSGARPEHAEL